MEDVQLATTISKEEECVILINTFFTSGPQDQDEVIKILISKLKNRQ